MSTATRYLVSRALYAFAIGVALTCVIGSVAEVHHLGTWGGKQEMAWPTAAALVAVCIAGWLQTPKKY